MAQIDNFSATNESVQELESFLFNQSIASLDNKVRFYHRLTCVWYLIQSEYRDASIDLDVAAVRCGVSKNHLNTLLRRQTGFTFYNLLLRYRLYEAVRLFCRRNYLIYEIAFNVGFGNPINFERTAKNFLGVSPRQLKVWCMSQNVSC